MEEFERPLSNFVDLRSMQPVRIPMLPANVNEPTVDSPSAEVTTPLPPRVSEQLAKFTNISRVIQNQAVNLALGETHALVYWDENGNITERYLEMNRNFLAVWNREREELYQEFASNPDAKQIADDVLERAKRNDLTKKTDEVILSPAQLTDIFNRE